jgi:hypothetical protein
MQAVGIPVPERHCHTSVHRQSAALRRRISVHFSDHQGADYGKKPMTRIVSLL